MVANLVGVVLVVTCAWGEGLHERRLGGGGQGTRRVQRAHRVLRCERAFPHPGIHLLQTPPTFSVAGQLSICAAGFVWKGDKTEMRPLCPFLQ